MIIISRPINGITLNGVEYVLDENGEVMKFESLECAHVFLMEAGYTVQDIEDEGIQFADLIFANENDHSKCHCGLCGMFGRCKMCEKSQRLLPKTANVLGLGSCSIPREVQEICK